MSSLSNSQSSTITSSSSPSTTEVSRFHFQNFINAIRTGKDGITIREMEKSLVKDNISPFDVNEPKPKVVRLTPQNFKEITLGMHINPKSKEFNDMYKEVINKQKSIDYHDNKSQVVPTFTRLPSSYNGNELIVGGVRKKDYDQNKFIINIDQAAFPDILGYAEQLRTTVSIPDAKFKTIIFEFIAISLVSNADTAFLNEYFRILQPGGSIMYNTEHDSEDDINSYIGDGKVQGDGDDDYHNQVHYIITRFKCAGFIHVQSSKKTDLKWMDNKNHYYLQFKAEKQ